VFAVMATEGHGGALRSIRARLIVTLGIIAGAVACSGAAAADAQGPTPINLRLSPGPGSISAAWGVSSTSGLRAFRVRWRPANTNEPWWWSAYVEVGPGRRSYVIEGLTRRAYQIRVRALTFEGLGGVITGESTPLLAEEPPAEEPAEEPPLEEEPPGEEPPEEESESRGEPIWYADPTKPILEDWANIMAEPGRITTTPDAAMPYGFAYSDEIRNGDNPAGYGERAEVGEGNPTRFGLEDRLFEAGQNRWIAFPFTLGTDFPLNTSSWYVIAQLKQLGSMGTPILSIASDEQGGIGLFNSDSNSGSSGNIRRWHGPVKLGQLNKLVLHVKFSANPTVGFVELYGDLDGGGMKLLMGKTYMSTMKQLLGVPIDDQARIGQYRDAAPQSGTAHVYYGRYVVATSRDVAEAYAFE
jgi:hypothetical protein